MASLAQTLGSATARPNWVMEPDMYGQQTGDWLPQGATQDDGGRLSWADTGEPISVVPRPNVLPFARTPDGIQLAMPKIADILGNLVGGGEVGAINAGIPLALGKRAPAAADAERAIAQGRHTQAWDNSADFKNGVSGVFQRPDGVNAYELPDYGMTAARGQLEKQAKRMQRDGVTNFSSPSSVYGYSQPISDIIGSQLYDHVPELRDWRIVGTPWNGSTHGWAAPAAKTIAVAADNPGVISFDRSKLINTASHEMQHAVDAQAMEAGLPIYTSGANHLNFREPELVEARNAAGLAYHPDAQRLFYFLGDMVDKAKRNGASLPFTMYQHNLGEALARVAGTTTAIPSADRFAWLKMTPNQRMSQLPPGEGPVSAYSLHAGNSSGAFLNAADNLRPGLDDPLGRLLPRGPE